MMEMWVMVDWCFKLGQFYAQREMYHKIVIIQRHWFGFLPTSLPLLFCEMIIITFDHWWLCEIFVMA